MNGISCTTIMEYDRRDEQLPGCERIIGELRDLAYEHFVIDLEGYPDGLRFVQTTRKDGKYLIELRYEEENGPRMLRKEGLGLPETLETFRAVCLRAEIPEEGWTDVTEEILGKGEEGLDGSGDDDDIPFDPEPEDSGDAEEDTDGEEDADGEEDSEEDPEPVDVLALKRPWQKAIDTIRFEYCCNENLSILEVEAHWNYVKIFINGKEILEILKGLMIPDKRKVYYEFGGDYAHRAGDLYHDLIEAFTPGTYMAKNGIEILCCAGCGQDGCWSCVAEPSFTEETVSWRVCWHYGSPLRFRFDREQYLQAIEDLRDQMDRANAYDRLKETFRKADEGDREAMAEAVIEMTIKGIVAKEADREIRERYMGYLHSLAAEDETKWLVMLGDAYRLGYNESKDPGQAEHYFMRAAELGEDFGNECIGEMYYEGDFGAPDYGKAWKYFTKDGNKKSPCTAYRMAEMYRLGRYVDEDPEKAYTAYGWIVNDGTPGAEKDDYYWRACFRMAQMRFYGKGVKRDMLEAAELMKKAERLACERKGDVSDVGIDPAEFGGMLDLIRHMEEKHAGESENVRRHGFDHKDTVVYPEEKTEGAHLCPVCGKSKFRGWEHISQTCGVCGWEELPKSERKTHPEKSPSLGAARIVYLAKQWTEENGEKA